MMRFELNLLIFINQAEISRELTQDDVLLVARQLLRHKKTALVWLMNSIKLLRTCRLHINECCYSKQLK